METQGSATDIAVSKATEAVKILREMGQIPPGTDYVITEDVGLALGCLNGFPGPYCKVTQRDARARRP